MKKSKKYNRARNEFRKELWKMMCKNPALPMLINAIRCLQYQKIMLNKIQEFALNELTKEDCKKLNEVMWKYRILGEFSDFWANMYDIDREFVRKFSSQIPESIAWKDANTVKIAFLKKRSNEKYYVITTCNGASDCIPKAEHIERNDALIERLDRFDIDDFKAAQIAKEDGIKLIDDIEGIYKDFYIDTPENRKTILNYIQLHPEEVGKELIGIE